MFFMENGQNYSRIIIKKPFFGLSKIAESLLFAGILFSIQVSSKQTDKKNQLFFNIVLDKQGRDH